MTGNHCLLTSGASLHLLILLLLYLTGITGILITGITGIRLLAELVTVGVGVANLVLNRVPTALCGVALLLPLQLGTRPCWCGARGVPSTLLA